jgi:hypothetical protein
MIYSAEALRMAVKDVGVKRVAAALGVSTSLIYKWCERAKNADGSPGSGTLNPLDRLALLVEITGDDRPVRWLAEAAGGFFTRSPSARPATGLGLLRQTQVLVREFADLLESVEESLADGRIEPVEAASIRREWEQLKSAGEMLVVSCERRAGVRTPGLPAGGKRGGPKAARPAQG